MSEVSVLAIDLAKMVFQIHGNNSRGKCVLKKKLRRSQLVSFVANLKPCVVAMEACAGAHYWAKRFRECGHEVKLISPHFVKPFVKGNKNDSADAEAIAEAVVRPNMRFVPIKSEMHIEIQALHRVRERLVKNRTALCNEIRGIFTELGIVMNKNIETVRNCIPEILAKKSEELSAFTKSMIADLHNELLVLDERIERTEFQLRTVANSNEDCKRLMKIPGIGLISATALLAKLADPYCFKNGRQFAAFLGLTPRHEGTGGKNKILGISKRGDKYIRCLMVHGARSSIRCSSKKTDKTSVWVKKLQEDKGYNRASVALANKNARIAWAIVSKKQDYCKVA